MNTPRLLLVTLMALPALAEDRSAPPIELRLRFADERLEWSGPPGQLPPLEVVVRNGGEVAVPLEGPLDGHGWTLGLSGWIKVTGPEGEEQLFRPTVADCSPDPARPLAPDEERVEGIWFERWFALARPGRYQVQVGLRTRAGDELASAPLAFEVAALAPSSPGLSVELVGVERNQHGSDEARLRFVNAGTEEVTVLRPQDGSEWGWLEPHYWFVVKDAEGRLVELPGRCGNHGADYASDRSYLRLAPGAREELVVHIPHRIGGGKHEVQFHYVQTARPAAPRVQVPGGGREEDPGRKVSPLAARLFLGVLSAGPIEIERPGPSRLDLTSGTPAGIVQKVLAALGEADEPERPELLGILQRLLALGVLGPREEGLIRTTLLGARAKGAPDPNGQVHELLVRLLDVGCAQAFQATILAAKRDEGMARYHAAVGLRRFAPRRAVESLIAELERPRLGDQQLEAISEALGVLTGLPHDEGPGPVMYPREPAQLQAARGRWLEWWKGEGSVWTGPAPCKSCSKPRGEETPCWSCGS